MSGSSPGSSTRSPSIRYTNPWSTPTRARSTDRRSFAPCSTPPGRQPGDREVNHEGRGDCRGAQGEQRAIGVPGVGKDVGEAVGGGRLPEREGGGAQAPGFSLLIGVVRDQL